MPIPKPAEVDEGYEEFFNSVSAQNESMDAFMNGLPSLRAGDGGMSVNGMQGYTPDRQPDTGDHAASISTLERLYCPPQLANLREEWEAAKEDDDLSTESGDWVDLNTGANKEEQDTADNVDEDGVVVQALPPAKAAVGCGLGGGPGAQFDNFCNPEEEGHGESRAEGVGSGSSQPYVPTLLKGGNGSRRRTLPLLSKSPSNSPPSKQQPAAAMSPEAAASTHSMAGNVSKQQPAAAMSPEAAAAAAAATYTRADNVCGSPTPPAQAALSVSTLHQEVKGMRLETETEEATAATAANTVSASTAGATRRSDRPVQQGKEAEAAALPCLPSVQGEGSQDALDCSLPEPIGEQPQARKQLPGGIVCTLPGACNVAVALPLLEHELEQDDQEMLQDFGLSPAAAASSRQEDSKDVMQEVSCSDGSRNLPNTTDPGSSTSQVEAFSLDKDFDYDNCKLTPREWPYNRVPHGPAPFSRQ